MEAPKFATLRIEPGPAAASATLLLARPERLNALSRELLGELVTASRWLEGRDDLKVVVVRGEGRAFSAGFDLGDFTSGGDVTGARDTADLGRLAAEALTNVPQLTIAAIHGHCVGGGLVMAAACDLRVAADDTRFSIPEVDLGIPLAWGGIPRLVRELGPAVTKELVLTCRPFDATEAKALRFVNTVVPRVGLDAAVAELAAKLAAQPRFALRSTKQQVNAATEEIVGTGRNANDADSLVMALHDPESRAAALRYLAARQSPKG